MMTYISRRILVSVPVLLGITVITFLAFELAPGDPIDAMIDPSVVLSPAELQARREALGLNKPVWVRYGIWLSHAVRGDLGYSFRSGEPVLHRIASRLPQTLQLTTTALVIALGLGIPLGMYSAVKQYSKIDYALTFAAFTGVSIPAFFFALGAIYIFSLKLGWLPSHGLGDPAAPNPWLERLRHLILPALVLGAERVAGFLRYTRSSMLEVIHQDYIQTARSKGLAEHVVILRHAFRNALISVITVVGLSIPSLFGCSVIIESVFNWPGMGQLAITAVTQRDYPVVMGVVLISGIVVLVTNLVTDIAYALVDPRIRYD